MSNEFAIAAVTRTLRNLLNGIINGDFNGLPEDTKPTAEILVTTLPLDKVLNGNETRNQINLFLYHVTPNAAWRNMDLPHRVKPGETGYPPLALNLHYIITAYGQDNNELIGHLLLGMAMRILHDHSVLSRTEIETALALSELHEQIERIRITPQPVSLDEISKLWTGFQSEYRLSAAYEVSVVLIESTRPTKTPLPVLTRGPDDRGVIVQPDLIPPLPTLEEVLPPNQQPSARLGDILTLSGHHLEGDSIIVRFMNSRLTDAIEVVPLPGGTATEITVQLPNEPGNWIAGFYTLTVVISWVGEPDRTTNELSFSLAPRILNIAPDPAIRDADDNVTLTVICSPEVRPGQRAALLLGDREILAQPHPAQTDTLTFVVMSTSPGEHFVRLRIDGVDSLLVDRTVTPPVFDQTQKVTIT